MTDLETKVDALNTKVDALVKRVAAHEAAKDKAVADLQAQIATLKAAGVDQAALDGLDAIAAKLDAFDPDVVAPAV
jgi:hypothetical protein